jgi:hypothetical protein
MQPVGHLAHECGVSRLVAFDFRCAVERLLARYVEAAPPKPVLVAARGGPSSMGTLHLAAAQAMSEANPTERVLASTVPVAPSAGTDLPLE